MNNDFSTGSAWAILPAQYDALVEQHKIIQADPEAVKEAAKYNTKTGKIELNIVDGVAIVDIHGTISNRKSFYSWMYGGAIIPKIKSELELAVTDYGVKSILLNIDSPGGTVAGVDDLSNYIKSIEKPVIAYTGGIMCSAAIWIGSAADKIIISKTSEVGSIGVLMVHTDYSKMDEQDGIKTTVLKAGKYKAVGNPYTPLSKEDKTTIQSELDYLYSIFVETVAQNKKAAVDDVLKMADGKVFIGQQAKDIGLVDQIGTLDDALQTALSIGQSDVKYFLLTGKQRKKAMAELNSIKELKDAFPDLSAELIKEGKDGVDVDGPIKAEIERILALAKVHFGENGEKFEALVQSGVTLAQYEAMKDIQPEVQSEEDLKAKILAELEHDSAGDPGSGEDDKKPKDFMSAWAEIKEAEKCSTKDAMSKAAIKFPELYEKHTGGK